MALTRKALTAMGIEADKIDQIVEMHAETVNGLKEQAEDLREQAGQVPALQKKIEELEAAQPTEDWEQKYGDLNAQFDAYKAQVEADRANAEKERLYRELLRDAGIDEKRLDAIMRVTDLSGVAVEDGKLADAEKLSESVAEEWAAFIPQVSAQGAPVPTPPSSEPTNGGNPDVMQRLQERYERKYGKAETKE